MKTTIKIAFLIILMSFYQIVSSQNEVDALRYSQLLHGGTARYMAMGGAFSALGADFSALCTNPAAIGVYKTFEFVITPGLSLTKINSIYNSKYAEDTEYKINFNNFGVVFTGNLATVQEKPEWKNTQFGFGINRLRDFNARYMMQGTNSINSILNVYSAHAQGFHYTNLDPFDTQLAFNTYLLDTLNGPKDYIQAHYGGAFQRKTKTISGGVNEMVLTLGGNYNDKLYLGATLGIPSIKYEETARYAEIDNEDTIPNFKSLTIEDDLKTTGTGFNMKFGLIYRINDWVRLSTAFHSPTFYSMTDIWSVKMFSDLENDRNYDDKSPQGRYEYRLETPMKAIAGLAIVIGGKGVISGDYEFIDYSTARLREKSGSGVFINQNDTIREKYTASHNFRVGTEWVFAPFAIRAGYALYTSPFKNNINDGAFQIISGGFGIREQNCSIDLTYAYTLQNEDYYFYTDVPTPVENELERHQIIFTFGIKF